MTWFFSHEYIDFSFFYPTSTIVFHPLNWVAFWISFDHFEVTNFFGIYFGYKICFWLQKYCLSQKWAKAYRSKKITILWSVKKSGKMKPAKCNKIKDLAKTLLKYKDISGFILLIYNVSNKFFCPTVINKYWHEHKTNV